ncbi:hypothetical protein [Yersinia massiliensis]|uniref:hypothetical protein n=1 Tax=Yersinia massiliensis TaxID=419257 RepID=UPI0021BD012F|nr:hypothetical protein [Yersinia massiliensis]
MAGNATNLFAQEKAKYDDSLLQDSVLKLNAGMQGIQTEQNQLQGQNAMGSAPAAIQKYHELAGEIGLTIPENRKRDWQRQVEGGALQLNGVTERHEFNQIQQYRQGQQKAIVDNGVTAAEGLYADPVAYKLNGARTRESIQTYGQSQGWSAEEIKAKQNDFTQKSALAAANALNGADYTAMLIQNGEPSDVTGSMRVPSSEQYGGSPGKVKGMSVAGNINLYNRPKVKNEDGSISTVRTISIESDGKEVLIPTVSDDGKILSDDDAITLFERTGKHLGMFDNADDATAYAESLHNDQEKLYTSKDSMAPRGIRNNNPGNIEFSENNNWEGQTGSDGRFATFETPEHGIRALGKNLLSYQRQGYETPEQIITRWAPPGKDGKENDTDAYIKKVCADLGVSADQPLDLTNIDTLTGLCASIMKHENGAGKVPFTPEQVSTGVQAALGVTQIDAVSRVTKTPYFNELDASTQAQVLRHADAMRKQEQSTYRTDLEGSLKDANAAYYRGQQYPNPPQQADFIRAYGFDKGSKNYEQFQKTQRLGGDIATVQQLPYSSQIALLNARKPVPGDGFADSAQRYDSLQTAINHVNAARQADPIQYAQEQQQAEPLNIVNPQAFGSGIAQRASQAGAIAQQYGTPLAVFSKAEAAQISHLFKDAPVSQQVSYLDQMRQNIGDESVYMSALQQVSQGAPSAAVAGIIMNKPAGITAQKNLISSNINVNPIDAATTILEGNVARKGEKGSKGIPMPPDKDLRLDFSSYVGNAFAGDAQGAEMAYQIAQDYYAGLSQRKGDITGEYDANRFKQAIAVATGGVYDYNGQGNVMLPWGMDESAFDNAVSGAWKSQVIDSGLKAGDVKQYGLQSYGDSQYLVRSGSGYLMDKEGRPVVLDLKREKQRFVGDIPQ